MDGYFTEKLLDPIIAESFCFYDGCTNVHEYIDSIAFVRIGINNIEESALRIEQCVNDGYYEKQLPYILREKCRILYELKPLNIIWAQLNVCDTTLKLQETIEGNKLSEVIPSQSEI